MIAFQLKCSFSRKTVDGGELAGYKEIYECNGFRYGEVPRELLMTVGSTSTAMV